MALKLMKLAEEGQSFGTATGSVVLVAWGPHQGLWEADQATHRLRKLPADGWSMEARRFQNWKYASRWEREIGAAVGKRPKPPRDPIRVGCRALSNAVEQIPEWARRPIRSKAVPRSSRWWAAVWLNWTGEAGVRYLMENPGLWTQVASVAWKCGRLKQLHWFVEGSRKQALRRMFPKVTAQGRNLWMSMSQEGHAAMWALSVWGLEERGIPLEPDSHAWRVTVMRQAEHWPLWARRITGRLVSCHSQPAASSGPVANSWGLHDMFSWRHRVPDEISRDLMFVEDLHKMLDERYPNEPALAGLRSEVANVTSIKRIREMHDEAAAIGQAIALLRFESEHGRMARGVAEPLFPGASGITPLITAETIIAEGALMKHCIAGYAKNAIMGRCHLYHVEIEVEGAVEHASLEIGSEGDIRQICGPRNKPPSAALRDFVNQWRAPHIADLEAKNEEARKQWMSRIHGDPQAQRRVG